ncbi:AbrB family transcriptional regulator [Enterococcus mundtii]|uniref:AbrB family transcriptional regulator n=1 Tax=Enterococcus mundtii TaxID=53346 RepID=UPI002158B927|nr:AbrB family transcriptional regulator [Enterococcus mundtii]
MLTTKSSLQDISGIIDLSSENGKKPPENREYIVVYSKGRIISLIIKFENPFKGGEEVEECSKKIIIFGLDLKDSRNKFENICL